MLQADMPVRSFNVQEFPGLVSIEVTSYQNTVLDYELDRPDSEVIHFTDCEQVEATREDDIVAAQYPLFQLLTNNCLILKKYIESSPAIRSYFPGRLSDDLLRQLPGDVIPYENDDDISSRRLGGKRLSVEMLDVEITSETGDTARVITKTDELVFNVLAPADFDRDGSEDLFIRVDWRILNAFSQGSDVFVIAKTDDASPI